MSSESRFVKKFARNEHGRDFVVGDIHGSYDLVWAAMQQAHFDKVNDRLFAVGDLIDRGPGSHRCLKFLAQPYVHAVLGNHEAMLLELYEDGTPDDDFLTYACQHNGLKWWLDVPSDERTRILGAFRKLPLVIEVATQRGLVGLVHADVPKDMSWPQFVDSIAAQDAATVQTCLWGRSRIKHADERGVAGIGRVFVGHTPQWEGVTRFGNVFAIDTGAVFGLLGKQDEGHLTMAHLPMQTMRLVAPRQNSGLVELKYEEDVPSSAFGSSQLGMVGACA